MAQAFMASGDYKGAGLSTMEVLKRDPRNVEACRIAVRLAELSNSPELLGWRMRLAEVDPSVDNKIALASVSLRREQPPFPVASKAIDDIQEQAANRADFHIVAAQRAFRMRMLPDAEQHLQEAVRLDPTNSVCALNLAVLHLESKETNVVSEARAKLEELSHDPQLGPSSLRALLIEAVMKRTRPTPWPSPSACSRIPTPPFQIASST